MQGEDLALRYLKKRGYVLLNRNWRASCGELDLVMLKKGVLVFVEVKTRWDEHSDSWGRINSLSESQELRIRRTAKLYCRRYHRNIKSLKVRRFQFDLLRVNYAHSAMHRIKAKAIEHIEAI